MSLLPDAEADPPRFLSLAAANRPQAVPDVSCPELDFRAWRNWRDVGEAVRPLAAVPFGQAWLQENEAAFLAAAAVVAHHGNDLIVYAELGDADIFNPVREHGAHAYQHGDVFEIFLRAEEAENYFEHHLTPDGITLQLSFPTLTAFSENCSSDPDWAKPFATAISVPNQILVQPALKTWRILAIVPLDAIARGSAPLPMHWRFSFCRYDYTHGHGKPVLSSTTPYRFANFHHQENWGHLRLVQS